MRAPSAIVYAPTDSPFPSSTADLTLPLAFKTSNRRKTRSSIPGEGCVEKVKLKGDEVELGEAEAVAIGERKVGLKALPLAETVERQHTIQLW